MTPAADRLAIPPCTCSSHGPSVRCSTSSSSNPPAPNAAGEAYTTGLMWCPAIGALLTCRYLDRPVAGLGWQCGQTRHQVFSYLISLGYSTVTYPLARLIGIAAINPVQTADAFSRFFGLGPLSRPFGIGFYFLVVATTGVIQNCATTLGEEIGWHGFLAPALAKRFISSASYSVKAAHSRGSDRSRDREGAVLTVPS